jgi:preprotein translocase subunit SecG
MTTFLISLQVIISVLLVIVVLLQFGKGAEGGFTAGSGASQNIFTSSSKSNFLTKLTTILAISFIVNCIVLGKVLTNQNKKSILDGKADLINVQLNSSAPAPSASAAVPASPTPEKK